MKNGTIQLMDIEFEHKLWKRRLELFISEVKLVMEHNKHLIPKKNIAGLNSVELLALEEHQDNLKKLKSRIDVKEQELKYYNKDFPITEKHEYFIDHLELRKKNDQMLMIHLDRVSDIIKEIGV
jgi:hypothetical protein